MNDAFFSSWISPIFAISRYNNNNNNNNNNNSSSSSSNNNNNNWSVNKTTKRAKQ